jgi:hypothetical protein
MGDMVGSLLGEGFADVVEKCRLAVEVARSRRRRWNPLSSGLPLNLYRMLMNCSTGLPGIALGS